MSVWKIWYYMLCIVLLSASVAAYADNLNLKDNTVYFLKLSDSLANGSPMNNRNMAKSLKLADQRMPLLLEAMRINPEETIRYALPNLVLSRLPKVLQNKMEHEITNLEGKLEVRALIYSNANEVIQYILKTNDGSFYYLHFTHPIKQNLKTDDVIRINRAYEFINQFGVKQLLLAGDDLTILKQAVALPQAFGPQKAIVMLTNFQDAPTNKPWTFDEVKNVIFGSVNGMFYEASFKQTTVVGNIVGYYTIPISSTADCDTVTNAVAQMASDAAKKAGVDLSSYNRRVFMFPRVRSCDWAGMALVYGTDSKAWLNGVNIAGVTAHELGHNIGLAHSHSIQCPGSPNTGNCTRIEYGDVADSMGAGTTAHFNAFQKERLGWLNYQISPPIRTVTTTGTYLIDPFETYNTNTKALKILKKSGTSSDFYYLEFRQPIGYDSVLNCSGCDYTQGVIIHQASQSDLDSSDLLDMSPNDNTTKVALLPGKTFKDPNAPSGGISITVNSVSAAGASVNVTFGGGTPSCVRALPTVRVSPSRTRYVEAGARASFRFTVINNDNVNCGASTFNIVQTTKNACVRINFNPNALTLAPGTSSTASINIQTSNLLDPGIYPITISAVNSTQPNYHAEGVASLGISTRYHQK